MAPLSAPATRGAGVLDEWSAGEVKGGRAGANPWPLRSNTGPRVRCGVRGKLPQIGPERSRRRSMLGEFDSWMKFPDEIPGGIWIRIKLRVDSWLKTPGVSRI